MDPQPPDSRGPDREPERRRRSVLSHLWIWIGVIWLIWIVSTLVDSSGHRTIPYSQFKSLVREAAVSDVVIEEDEIRGTARPADSDSEFHFQTHRITDEDLVRELETAGIDYRGGRPPLAWGLILAWVIPLGLLLLLWWLLMRSSPIGRGLASFGKSKARIVADDRSGVTFTDVAGCDEAKLELAEVVSFLREPGRFARIGARIPKGVLLLGPPGTGKTLLARAVAGEAGVPFFSLSGSEFVEMFVGVGASRVRDLFEQAKLKAPCIVFIDEIDAVGRQRGVHMGAVNDEREQTLNQLLVEMDGFEANAGVILLAATNRPDVLDAALLRPGRFDRQVVLDAPDLTGRAAILEIHCRGKPLAEDVDLGQIARATPGFSGADLANAVNEAALLAARERRDLIQHADLEGAVEKVVAGPERRSRRLGEAERHRVAVHEAGHALVAFHCPHADPVQKISIVPRGRAALGYTLQLPSREHFLLAREELDDRIRGLLGGRAAEEVVLGSGSTGAEDDLQRATALARRMVCAFGMGDAIGLLHCAEEGAPDLQVRLGHSRGADCAEATARLIDEEVQGILGRARERATQLIEDHRQELDSLVEQLLSQETVEAPEIAQILGGQPGADRLPRRTAPRPPARSTPAG